MQQQHKRKQKQIKRYTTPVKTKTTITANPKYTTMETTKTTTTTRHTKASNSTKKINNNK